MKPHLPVKCFSIQCVYAKAAKWFQATTCVYGRKRGTAKSLTVFTFATGSSRFTYSTHLGVMCHSQPGAEHRAFHASGGDEDLRC